MICRRQPVESERNTANGTDGSSSEEASHLQAQAQSKPAQDSSSSDHLPERINLGAHAKSVQVSSTVTDISDTQILDHFISGADNSIFNSLIYEDKAQS
jgi:hypothetical protein